MRSVFLEVTAFPTFIISVFPLSTVELLKNTTDDLDVAKFGVLLATLDLEHMIF